MVNTLKYVVLGIYKLINDVTYFYFLLKKFFDFDRKNETHLQDWKAADLNEKFEK